MKHKKLLSFINFLYAFEGILFLIKTERNPVIYLVVTILVTILGFFCHLSKIEWSIIVLATTTVWMAEALNTAVELLADEISEEKRERLGRAKDVAAGGVLFVALGAVIVGALIFLPHLIVS
ncbi:MAG: diacylglycerol kinase family protein [Verrucomicrobia bacterium]|jgi:diacylglycerol kinase (ATP)|nr:MAG: diacylglycerol kinase family protein [Verrucomicrobiota bacterium]MDH4469464.1 diacylglycerol kinase family protein [Verrucomicrobiae bacterium]